MKNPKSGFTVIELIVAMSVFVIAIALITGVFVRSMQSQRQVNLLMSINSEASLILERVAREIRVGYNFQFAGGGCGSGSSNITFYRAIRGTETQVTYNWDGSNENIERQGDPINASQVAIKRFCFREIHSDNPEVVNVVLSAGPRDDAYTVDLQTTISARVLAKEIQL